MYILIQKMKLLTSSKLVRYQLKEESYYQVKYVPL